MELTDILSVDDWARFEKTLFDRFHMNCTVYNTDGIGVTGKPNWCNTLCPKIKANKESLSAICATGNQNFMAQAKQTQKSVIGECDAGLLKITVPIFVDTVFMGTAGGCGLLPEDGEVEEFMLHKLLGVSEDKITELSNGLATRTQEQAEEMAEYIEAQIDQFIHDMTIVQ